MAKPTLQPRWADLASDPSQRTAPTSGLQNVGWAVGDRPAAQHVNWLFYIIYQWLLYLSALLGGSGVSENLKAGGIDTTGASTIGGTLGVTGLSTLANLSVTANASVGNNLGVTGNTTVQGNLQVTGTTALNGNVNGPVTFGGNVTFSNQPTAPDYHHTTARTRVIPAMDGVNDAGGTDWSVSGAHVTSTGTPGAFKIPVPVEAGQTITVRVRVAQSTATASGIHASLERTTFSGTTETGTTVATVNNTATTNPETLTIVSSHAVVADSWYYVNISANATTETRFIYDVQVDYTR